jgi:hypothetical protein
VSLAASSFSMSCNIGNRRSQCSVVVVSTNWSIFSRRSVLELVVVRSHSAKASWWAWNIVHSACSLNFKHWNSACDFLSEACSAVIMSTSRPAWQNDKRLTLKAGFFKRRWVPNSLSNDLENVTSAQVGHVYYYGPLKSGRAAHPLANMFTTSCNLELGMVLAMSG